MHNKILSFSLTPHLSLSLSLSIYIYIYIKVWPTGTPQTYTHACTSPPASPSSPQQKRARAAARARRITASSAARPEQPNDPYTAPLSTIIVIAPEDVEHAVGRRREARHEARGGARAGGGQRRPGVGRCAEAVQVVDEAFSDYVYITYNTHAHVHRCACKTHNHLSYKGFSIHSTQGKDYIYGYYIDIL
jgi:hypothetical protein